MLVPHAHKIYTSIIPNSPNQKHKYSDLIYEVPLSDILGFENIKIGDELDLTVDKTDVMKNIRVCLIYYSSWLKGTGALAFENLMEDAATTEICRI